MHEEIAFGEPVLARRDETATREADFEAFVARQSRFVFRVAFAVLRHPQDAEDVTQETFLKLYRTRSWERIDDERAFLARMAWRLSVNAIRARRRHIGPAESPSPEPGPERDAIAADWGGIVQRMMDALPEELRHPLALSAIDEMTSPEIARALGIAEGTVRTRIMRARQILKQKIAALMENRHGKR